MLLFSPHRTFQRLLSTSIIMGSNHLLLSRHSPYLSTIFTNPLPFSSSPTFLPPQTSQPPFLPFPLTQKSGLCYAGHTRIPRPVTLEPRQNDKTMDPVPASLSTLKKKLEEQGIHSPDFKTGENPKFLCPKCEGGDSSEKSLSLLVSKDGKSALWYCFRAKCGWKGGFGASKSVNAPNSRSPKTNTLKPKKVITVEGLGLEPLCEELYKYFAERMISAETLRRNAVMQTSGSQVAIAFTYRREGVLVSCKYLDITKIFWQEKDTEKIFYGVDDIKGVKDIIIVEGEIDKLSMEEAGFRNCVSVPDGAPPTVSNKKLPSEDKDKKYQYLWNCKEYLEKASRIILATDHDPPGQALAEELARRFGRERCWRVKWPKKTEVDFCKDANEVLMYLGPDALREVVEQAELYPIQGLYRFNQFFHEIDAYYARSHGFELGVSTGWKNLDDLYKVVPGELTIITGVPNSGKSEWIDALLCNLNESKGWSFALCSMENNVREHARKLLEKHIKKPFFETRYSELVERMSKEDLEQGKEWLNDTFHLIRCEDDCLPSIKWVLDLAKAAVFRNGVRGLVIDPYNELDHQRLPNQTETEYVSQMLTKIKRFAQHHACHVWFVAHPRQMHQWDGKPPNMYDISGSAHFINKCDNGIVIHRNRDEEAGPLDLVQVCVRKVRNKVVGRIGEAYLSYDSLFAESQVNFMTLTTFLPQRNHSPTTDSQEYCVNLRKTKLAVKKY